MNKVGRHLFFVVPLEILKNDPPFDYVLARERWWMQRCGGVKSLLNISLGTNKCPNVFDVVFSTFGIDSSNQPVTRFIGALSYLWSVGRLFNEL